MASQGWGYWTEAKLDILSAYLPAFARASTRAGSMVYLDLFAGNVANHRRDTGDDIRGSAVRALDALPAGAPIYLFELGKVAVSLDESLKAQFPDRAFQIVSGDCNETLEGALDDIRAADQQWMPMFAFIDPYKSSDLQWGTLCRLADFKRDKKFKVELWVLFFGSNIPRVLGQRDSTNARQVSRTFGCDDWIAIAEAREMGTLNARKARYEYTNLMRWRLVHELGYKSTHSLEIKNTSGSYLYDLIFATDNDAGDTIMRDVYRKALQRNETMRLEAVEVRRGFRTGQASLFAPSELGEFVAIDLPKYQAIPPTTPFGLPGYQELEEDSE